VSEVSKRSCAQRFWAIFTSRTVKEELFSFSCFPVEVLRPSREALLGSGHGRGLGCGALCASGSWAQSAFWTSFGIENCFLICKVISVNSLIKFEPTKFDQRIIY
jgi:hypothetical protein